MLLFRLVNKVLIFSFFGLSLSMIGQNAAMVIDRTSPNQNGLDVIHAGSNGVYVKSAIYDGVRINSAGADGISITSAGADGISVGSVQGDGVYILNAGSDGYTIGSAVVNGVRVGTVGVDGYSVESAGFDGFYVKSADYNGLSVKSAGKDGVTVEYAEEDGIHVGSAGGYSLNILGEKNQDAITTGHIAQIYNYASGGSADVLALKVGQNSNPTTASNFITFFNGSDTPLGRIEGNGNGGVSFASGSGDFAEYLQVNDEESDFQPGDVVGIINGKVSHNTSGTNKVMAITDRPIVVGNQQEDTEDYQMIGFIGQVPVRVRGEVVAGDWIVASGLSDGTAISINPSDITLEHKIVGQAWESSDDLGIKRVNTAIGLDQSESKDRIIEKMRIEMDSQEVVLRDLQTQIDELKKVITSNSN